MSNRIKGRKTWELNQFSLFYKVSQSAFTLSMSLKMRRSLVNLSELSNACDQSGERVSKNGKRYHICSI